MVLPFANCEQYTEKNKFSTTRYVIWGLVKFKKVYGKLSWKAFSRDDV